MMNTEKGAFKVVAPFKVQISGSVNREAPSPSLGFDVEAVFLEECGLRAIGDQVVE